MTNEPIAMELTKAYINNAVNLKIEDIVKIYFEFLYYVDKERLGEI